MSNQQPQYYQSQVTAENATQRLDKFLMSALNLSRNQIKRLLDARSVKLNNKTMTPKNKGLILSTKDNIQVDLSFIQSQKNVTQELIQPQAGKLSAMLLSQNSHYLVINKPAGMPVHPLKLAETNTVLNTVIAEFPQVQGVGEGGLRSGVVHRLDVTTSGTLAVAITQEGWDDLRNAFKHHKIKKTYHAIVQGYLDTEKELNLNLAIVKHKPARVSVINQSQNNRIKNTRLCHLSYKPIRQLHNATLIEVDLGTGFLHQIRAMMSFLSHPLLGDPLYDGPVNIETASQARLEIYRPMLHAASLKYNQLNVQCPYPKDFHNALKQLEK